MKFEIASRVRPGDSVPPVMLHLGPNTVRSVEPDPDRHGNLLIGTTQGTLSFHPSEKVAFPRRPDGSRRDWWSEGINPLLRDVCIGDTLPPANPKPPSERNPWEDEKLAYWLRVSGAQSYDDLPQQVKDQFEQDFWMTRQEVVSMWMIDSLEWGFACYEPLGRITRNYRGHIMAAVEFPRQSVARVDPAAREYTEDGLRVVYAFGPYEHKLRERYFMFAEHPYGRGRWPADIKPWDEVDNDQQVVVTRPPKDAEEWSFFAYAGSSVDVDLDKLPAGTKPRPELHPKDPRAKKGRSGPPVWSRGAQ